MSKPRLNSEGCFTNENTLDQDGKPLHPDEADAKPVDAETLAASELLRRKEENADHIEAVVEKNFVESIMNLSGATVS